MVIIYDDSPTCSDSFSILFENGRLDLRSIKQPDFTDPLEYSYMICREIQTLLEGYKR